MARLMYAKQLESGSMKKASALYLLLIIGSLLSACTVRDGSYNEQGVKLEDTQNKDMNFNSPLPNGSPDTPPSEMSASPSGSSLGSSPAIQ